MPSPPGIGSRRWSTWHCWSSALFAAIAIGNELPQAATKPDGVSGAREFARS
jgi:hypothetical protein